MPPANSPAVRSSMRHLMGAGDLTSAQQITTPPTLEPSTPFFEQLAEITSPVPDLASTLRTQAEQEINDSNLRFLRSRPPTPPYRYGSSRLSPERHPPVRNMPSPPELSNLSSNSWRTTDQEARNNVPSFRARNENLRQFRRQIPGWEAYWLDQHNAETEPYRGWAPGTSEDPSQHQSVPPRSNMSSAQLYNQWSSRMRELRSNRAGESNNERRQELLRTAREMSRFHEQFEPPTISESAIRSTTRTLVPRQEPHPQRSTQHLERYLWDRAQGSAEQPEQDTSASIEATNEIRRQRERIRSLMEFDRDRSRNAETSNRDERGNTETALERNMAQIRGQVLQDPGAMATERGCKMFEQVISAVTKLCTDWSQEKTEDREEKMHKIHLRLELLHKDRLCDYQSLLPLPYTSWLHVNSSFSGAQQAPPPAPSNHASRPSPRSHNRPIDPSRGPVIQQTIPHLRGEDPTALIEGNDAYTEAFTSRIDNPPVGPHSLPQRWPVRVTFDHVDYDTMTITGTMEAFNSTGDSPPSPSTSPPTTPSLDEHAPASSSVKSFMQGEIIDFKTHMLESKKQDFKGAQPRVDANNWRRLGPFKGMSDIDCARAICSKNWMTEKLWGKWILMRWRGM